MNRYLFICISLLSALNLRAQNVGDTLITFIDTINVHGKVIDIEGKPLAGVTVHYNFDQRIKTNKKGLFQVNGVNPQTDFIFDSPQGRTYLTNFSSRYLLVTLQPTPVVEINNDKNKIVISAKKIAEKPKYKKVIGIKENVYDFDGGDFMGEAIAKYPDGLGKLCSYVNHNIIYPKKAIENQIEGLVTIRFDIDVNGMSDNFIVINDLGYGCAAEVIRILKLMKKWTPKISNGKPIKSTFSINIPFKLVE